MAVILTIAIGAATIATAAIGTAFMAPSVLARPDASFLSLADAWALAEHNHPKIIEARQRLSALERDVRQREAAYAPSVTVSSTGLSMRVAPDGRWDWEDPGASVNAGVKLRSGLSLSASATVRSRSGSTSSAAGNALRGSISMTYPLLRSAELDGDGLALRQAELALASAKRELEQLRDEVRAEVLTALHAEQVAAVRLRLARDGYEEAQAAWTIVEQQVDMGIATEVELIAAEVELLRAEHERLVAERTLEARRRDLLKMLGLESDLDFSHVGARFEDVLGLTDMPPPGNVDEAMARAVANSSVVRERIEAVETARLQLAAEKERAGLSAQMSGQYIPAGTASDSQRDGWTLELQLSYPLTDGGQRRMAVEAREEAYLRAQEALAEAERDVRERVQELFHQLEDARRDVDIASLELTRAELELAAATRQAALPVPAASGETVGRAARAVVRAELAWLEAVQRYQARWIELQRLQGAVPWEMLLASTASATAAEGEGTK